MLLAVFDLIVPRNIISSVRCENSTWHIVPWSQWNSSSHWLKQKICPYKLFSSFFSSLLLISQTVPLCKKEQHTLSKLKFRGQWHCLYFAPKFTHHKDKNQIHVFNTHDKYSLHRSIFASLTPQSINASSLQDDPSQSLARQGKEGKKLGCPSSHSFMQLFFRNNLELSHCGQASNIIVFIWSGVELIILNNVLFSAIFFYFDICKILLRLSLNKYEYLIKSSSLLLQARFYIVKVNSSVCLKTKTKTNFKINK